MLPAIWRVERRSDTRKMFGFLFDVGLAFPIQYDDLFFVDVGLTFPIQYDDLFFC